MKPAQPDLIDPVGYLARLDANRMGTGMCKQKDIGNMDIARPGINTCRIEGVPISQMDTPLSRPNLIVYLQPDRIMQLTFEITFAS